VLIASYTEAAADTGAQREHDQVPADQAPAVEYLGERCARGVVVNEDRLTEPLGKHASQRSPSRAC
jgi:hypothetical protein